MWAAAKLARTRKRKFESIEYSGIYLDMVFFLVVSSSFSSVTTTWFGLTYTKE